MGVIISTWPGMWEALNKWFALAALALLAPSHPRPRPRPFPRTHRQAQALAGCP